MRKVLLYSFLLTAGLAGSQFLPGWSQTVIQLLTMFCLALIAIRIGYGFEITRNQPQKYFWDAVVGTTITVIPWLLCAMYFVFAMAPRGTWHLREVWWDAALLGRFAAPTSVGILFSMLAAAGLSGTWIYRKARTLAIFDDLEVILLFIPIKILLINADLRVIFAFLVIFGLLWAAWKYVHVLNLPVSWPWMALYSVLIVILSESINLSFKAIDDAAPVKMEVLLLGFILGCMLARSTQSDGQNDLLESPRERSVATIVAASFMVLAGLSLPHVIGVSMDNVPADAGNTPKTPLGNVPFTGWGPIAIHVLIVTVLSNIGKMFPALCYRKEASLRERLALAIGMFPRGEVGASMLIVSLSYGITGPALTVAALSLALNLLLSGFFILVIKKLVAPEGGQTGHPL